MVRHLLSMYDTTARELKELMSRTASMKESRGRRGPLPLAGKSVALLFSEASTRTRVSFEVAINELGGQAIYLSANEIQIRRGESMADTARVISRYVHGMVIRTSSHAALEEFAAHSAVPVINGLSDLYHPCQILGDLFTLTECKGRLEGLKVAFLGDGSCNVCNSWVMAADKSGIVLTVGAPEGYRTPAPVQKLVPPHVRYVDDPREAVRDADVVYTDTWVSMGKEAEYQARLDALSPFQVNEDVLAAAKPDAIFMHCLPAYPGREVTGSVLYGKRSVVWQQAENRLHVQKAILADRVGVL